jgi:hypothetical protein
MSDRRFTKQEYVSTERTCYMLLVPCDSGMQGALGGSHG